MSTISSQLRARCAPQRRPACRQLRGTSCLARAAPAHVSNASRVAAPGDDFSLASRHVAAAPAAAFPQPALDGGCGLGDAALHAAHRASRVSARSGVARAAPEHAPVAAAVAEEGEVLHVLARRHRGNALERELSRRQLLENLSLGSAARAAPRRGRVSSGHAARVRHRRTLRRRARSGSAGRRRAAPRAVARGPARAPP